MADTTGNNALLGSIIEAGFGSDKPPKPIYRDRALRELELGLTGGGQTALNQLPDYLAAYRRNLRADNPALRAATTDYGNALRNILNRQSTPMSDLTGIGDYLFGSYGKNILPYVEPIARGITNRTNVNNLARGYSGGAAGSSYGDTLALRSLGQTAANYGLGIASLLPQLYQSQQASTLARDAALQGILPAIQAGYAGTERRALAPWQAYVGGLGDLQQFGMGQNALGLGNLQGYQPVKNWANRVGDVGRAITSNIDKYLQWAQQLQSLYTGGLGGGGGGMGSLGGLFGGGGGGTPATNAYPGMNATGANMLNQSGQPFGTTYNPYTDSSQFFWGS